MKGLPIIRGLQYSDWQFEHLHVLGDLKLIPLEYRHPCLPPKIGRTQRTALKRGKAVLEKDYYKKNSDSVQIQ